VTAAHRQVSGGCALPRSSGSRRRPSSSGPQTVKVVEVTGESNESRPDAAQNAVDDATATLEGVSGIEAKDQTAAVEEGRIVQYRTAVHVAFPGQR